MKLAFKITCALATVCLLMLNSGCKPHQDPKPAVTDVQLDLLKKSEWNAASAKKDNVDQMADYGAFHITFSGSAGQTTFAYTTSGRPAQKYPWAVNGNLTFDATNPTTTLTRDDATPVVVTYSVTATDLSMRFNYTGAGFPGDRQTVVSGQWEFTFTH